MEICARARKFCLRVLYQQGVFKGTWIGGVSNAERHCLQRLGACKQLPSRGRWRLPYSLDGVISGTDTGSVQKHSVDRWSGQTPSSLRR
jgi:hypothetical protein